MKVRTTDGWAPAWAQQLLAATLLTREASPPKHKRRLRLVYPC